jgi:hypothetical protein
MTAPGDVFAFQQNVVIIRGFGSASKRRRRERASKNEIVPFSSPFSPPAFTINLMPDPAHDPPPDSTRQGSTPDLAPHKPAPPPTDSPALGASPAPSTEPLTDFQIGDEFGTAKRNLPPARIVLAAIAIIAVIVAIVAFHERPKPQGAGSINFVVAVEVPGQNIVLAAITFTLRNTADKSMWIRSLKAQLAGADGHTYEDQAASAVDLDRYYQAFPPLRESSEPPLSPETKLLPGTEKRGTIVVSFPMTKEAFDQRKSLALSIQPYDQPVPITLK